jgi:hypothetical protein
LSLAGESDLVIVLNETGIGNYNELPFLILSGITSENIVSKGAANGENFLFQLADTNNNLTTVTISGSEFFALGQPTNNSAISGDGVVTDIGSWGYGYVPFHTDGIRSSSLKLIDASATTGGVAILAGADSMGGYHVALRITYAGWLGHRLYRERR